MVSDASNGDASNGYEAIAAEFIAVRETRSAVGALTVRDWASTVRPGGAVLDLGCAVYRRLLEAAGLELIGERDDEGDNRYYLALEP